MLVALKRKWAAAAGAGAAVLCLAGPAQGAADGGADCIKLSDIASPRTPEQRRLAGLFREAVKAPAGRAVFDRAARAGGPAGDRFAPPAAVKVCFRAQLNEKDACGNITVAYYDSSEGLLAVNPDKEFGEALLVPTMVHELRHKSQLDTLGGDGWMTTARNVPGRERVLINWLTEADARLAAVVYAWEMAQRGEGKYADDLRKNAWYRPLLAAFEASLAQKPGDMRAAMQAAVMTFTQVTPLARNYANAAMDYIERAGARFDPLEAAETVMDEVSLRRLGSMGPHGNYIDAAFIGAFGNNFTEADYEALVKIRALSGGTRGAACASDEDSAPPAVPHQFSLPPGLFGPAAPREGGSPWRIRF